MAPADSSWPLPSEGFNSSSRPSWPLLFRQRDAETPSDSRPPPYEPAGDSSAPTDGSKAPEIDSTLSSSSTASRFCCAFDTNTSTYSETPSLLTNHANYSFRILGPQTDAAIHGKYNRFLLWAGHNIAKPLVAQSGGVQLMAVPWVYLIELLDYRLGPEIEGQYFMAVSDKATDKGRGGYERVPYERGKGVRMGHLTIKSSMMLKCHQHNSWFEVNFYC